MVKRSRQPGLIDAPSKIKAPSKKRAAATATSNQPRVGEAFKVTKARALTKGKKPRRQLGSDKDGAPTKASEKHIRPKTICSVDFGTTYSGVAIVGSVNSAISDIEVLCDWVDSKGYHEKVPSRIAYPEDNPDIEKITFGYEVTTRMKSYTWMKLLLTGNADKDTLTEPHIRHKAGHGMLELPAGKTAQNVVIDYMRCLYDHIIDHLAEVTPTPMLEERSIEFWLTTPACWDNEANDITRRCAKKAGFGSRAVDELYMMSEPEAALLANLSTSIDKHEGIYHTGMHVCVCDIGGGTIDTQTLTLKELNPLRTQEACVGSGAKVGMTDIEFKLHDHCETWFGDSFRNLPAEVVGPSSDFAAEFEVIKRSFDGKDLNKTYRLRLLPLKSHMEIANLRPANYDFVDGTIILKGTDIREMFEELIEKALQQFDKQVAQLARLNRKPISMVVLAGGGGTSKYVISRFQEHCQKRLGGTVMVRRDGRAWSAVARGAAVRGLESGTVVSRESKRAYGLLCHKKFDESIDEEEDSFQCPVFGKRARDRMDWILHKGDTIMSGRKLTKAVYISPEDMSELTQHWELFECEDDEAPERLEDDGVEKIGRIKVALCDNELARKKQRRSLSDGTQEPIRIKLEFTFGSKIGVMEVHAFHGRTEVGRTEIEYAREKGRRRRCGARSACRRS